MEEKETLIKMGLTEKEARAYLLALQLGEINSGDLIKKLNVYSKTSYEILNKLVEKGFLSIFMKGNFKFYSPISPEKLKDVIKEKQLEIDQIKKEVEILIPNLKKVNKESNKKQQATIYEGKRGLKFIFEDSLRQNKEILVFGGGGKFKEFFPEYFELWNKLRIKSKIKLRILYSKGLRNNITNYSLTEIKFLPKEFENPSPTMVYEDIVAITIWTEKPIAFFIESKEVASSYKNYFEILWKIAKK